MNLTKSEQAYKEAVIENSKPKYTASPLDDPKTREETEKIAESEYGKEKAEEIKQKTSSERFVKAQDSEVDVSDDLDIVDYKSALNFDEYIDALNDTAHLKNFKAFDKYLGLDGKSYSSFKKALWYFAHSLKMKTISYKINYKTKVDNRFHILAIAPPASGKSTSKNKMKRLVDPEDCAETGGLCHPQQLIGKTIPATPRKAKKEIPGLLSYKLLIHDEVQDMLNEENDLYSASQKLRRQAMDPYGDNQIDKKLVSNAPGEETTCISPTRFLDYAHPKKLKSAFYDTGSFRRPFIFNLQAEDKINLDDLTEFKLDESNFDDYPIQLEEETKSLKLDTRFDERTLSIISHCHKCILKFLLKCKNENAFRYGMLSRYNFRYLLSRNVYLLALSNGEKIPSVPTTLMACRDTILFILESIKSVNELSNIGTTSDVWKGLEENDAMALTWLLKIGALSYETSKVSINKLWTVLAHIYGCKQTQSRAHYYRLKKDGYIDSRKGKNESKVWLTFIPKELKIIETDTNDLDFLEKLSQECRTKKSVLTVLNEVGIDDKALENAKTAGSVGVLGYIFNNICVEVYELYYINKIYVNNLNRGVSTPTQPTLLQNEQPTATTNDENKTVKQQKTDRHSWEEERPYDVPGTPQTRDDVEIQYYEAPECESIREEHTLEQIKAYLSNNPSTTKAQLVEKFGSSVLRFKREGLFE